MPPSPEDQLAQIREAIGRLYERMREFEARLTQLEGSAAAPPAEPAPPDQPPPVRAEVVSPPPPIPQATAEQPTPEQAPPAEATPPSPIEFEPVEEPAEEPAEQPASSEPAPSEPAPLAAASSSQDTHERPSARPLSTEEKLARLATFGQPREPAPAAPTPLAPAESIAAEPIAAEPVIAAASTPPPSRTPARPAFSGPVPPDKIQELLGRLKNIDWEQFLGAKGAMWAGSITTILAIAFGIVWVFTKYDLPYLKSGSFHVMGLAFLAAGHYLHSRKKAPLLGEALAGLGIFTLYAVAFAGKRWFDPPLYGSLTDTVTFIECCLITLAAVAIAVRVPSVIVVLLGALGGYLTPFVIGGDPPNHVLLFTYLAFLNTTLIASAVIRGWSFLKPLTFAATAGVFFLWLRNPYFAANHADLRWSTEWLVVLHAAIFLLGSTIPPVLWKRRSNQLDLSALSASSLWLMGMTWQLFRSSPHQQLALLSWGLALLHLGLFGLTYSRVTNIDRMPRIHLALSAIFFTLAIPLQLEDASYLAMAWACEGVVFAAVGLWFRDRQMYVSSLIVFTLSGLHLLGWVYWQDPAVYEGTQLDTRFFIFLCTGALAMLGASAYKWMPQFRDRELNAWERYSSIVLFICGNVAVLLSCPLQWPGGRMVLALWTLDVAIVWAIGFAMHSRLARIYAVVLAALFVGGRLWLHGIADPPAYDLLLNSRFGTLLFAGGVLAVVGWFYRRLPSALRDRPPAEPLPDPLAVNVGPEEQMLHALFTPLGHLLILVAILCEVHSGGVFSFRPSADRDTFIMTGYSLATALYAAALLAGGFALRYPLYRAMAGLLALGVLGKAAALDHGLATYKLTSWELDIRFLMGEACALVLGLAAASYLLPALRRGKFFDQLEANCALVILGLANMVALFAMTCQWSGYLVLAIWAADVALVWTLGFRRHSLPLRCYALFLAILFLGGRIAFHQFADPDPYRIVFNGRFATLALVAAVLGVFGWLYSRLPKGAKQSELFGPDLDERQLHTLLGGLAHALALTAIVYEIHSGIVLNIAEFPGRHTLFLCWSTLAAALYAVALLAGGVALRYLLYRVLAGLLAAGVLLKAAALDYFQPSVLWWGERVDARFLLGEASTLLVALAAAAYLLPALRKRIQPERGERLAAYALLGAANIVALHLMTLQWSGRLVLILWTINTAVLWAVGFRRQNLALRWYAAFLGLFMVGGRMLFEGASYGEPYRLLANDRCLSLVLVAALYFAAGWWYRRAHLRAAQPGDTQASQERAAQIEAQVEALRAQGMHEEHAREFLELENYFDPLLGILANGVLVVALSLEVHTWFAVAEAAGRQPFPDMAMARQASYSILWAVYAAAIVVAGFLLRYPLFRYLGLIAFVPILLKVFFVDLAWLEMLPRVLALAVLGAMLLGVAFLYQRFAARLLDEPEKETPPPETQPPEEALEETSPETTPPASAAAPGEQPDSPIEPATDDPKTDDPPGE